MRIAIDTRLVSYARGGISQYTIRLVHALAALSPENQLLIMESRRAQYEGLWPPSVRRRRLFTPPHHRFEQVTLPAELLGIQADLLHSPDFIPPFRLGLPSVITVHDLAFLRFPHLLTPESARYYGQIGRAVHHADRIITVSHSTRKDLLELLPADPQKVVTIHSGVDPECRPLPPAEVERQRAQLGLPEQFILFVGTLEPRKNIPTLLKAFSKVWKDHRVPLVVVGGKGWLYEEIFQVTDDLGVGEAVRYVDPVPSQQLVYYYNCASCLVLPSLYEGFGHPPLEAMACGTPVIVSNVSSLPEVVGEAGLLVEPTDVEGLAAAMGELLSNQELRSKLTQLGLQRAATFSWEKTARETLSEYEKAVRAGR